MTKLAGSKRKASIKPPLKAPQPLKRNTRPKIAKDKDDDFKVAVDFGTTYTAVAYFKPKEWNGEDKPKVRSIGNWNRDFSTSNWEKGVATEVVHPSEARDSAPTECDIEALKGAGYRWGYDVQNEFKRFGPQSSKLKMKQRGHVEHMKLLLDPREFQRQQHSTIEETLQHLKKRNLIRANTDVIRDFLASVLRHTRRELENREGLTQRSQVEFVFCVPVSFEPSSRRKMEVAFLDALEASGFSPAPATGRYKVFMRLETFVLMDCGGGTCDVGTYHVDNSLPLRIEVEVNHADGDLCGSYYLNDGWRKLWKKRLSKEKQILDKGLDVDYLLDRYIVTEFEREIKRCANLEQFDYTPDSIFVPGLEADDSSNYIVDDGIMVEFADLVEVFDPVLEKVNNLMVKQIEKAKQSSYNVDKVIVVGGFAESPALQNALIRSISDYNNANTANIQLIWPEKGFQGNTRVNAAAAVAIGAVLRSLNKTLGPRKYARISFGLLRHEPVEHDKAKQTRKDPAIKSLLNQRPARCPISGEKFWFDVIRWFIRRVDDVGGGAGDQRDELRAGVHIAEFESTHTFRLDDAEMICREEIWESPNCVSNKLYHIHDPRNKGSERIGAIEWSAIDLKKYLKPVQSMEYGRSIGEPHYEITFKVVIRAIDRNLEFTAYWDHDLHTAYKGTRQSFSICAAFDPGTDDHEQAIEALTSDA